MLLEENESRGLEPRPLSHWPMLLIEPRLDWWPQTRTCLQLAEPRSHSETLETPTVPRMLKAGNYFLLIVR